MMADTSQSSNQEERVDLYAPREKIFAREVKGRFQSLRTLSVYILLGLFYLVPWVQWGERQAVLFDLPERKFYILGLVFWPQDFVYLTALLIIAALAFFLFMAIAGRLWCGYACPQTVWTEVFVWIERAVEGSRAKQMRLEKESLSARKFRLKATKHALWVILSLWTGLTFVGYFSPVRELIHGVVNLSLGPWELFWIIFYGFATYGNAGWMREQVCTYMCPYARFQSAMFDRKTLIVSFDASRGEPRGSRRRGTDAKAAGLGDCIDCTLCVQVCPTGIDIRDGLQYQCISCAACVDVCDEVMDKMQSPRGLIRYTSEAVLDGESDGLSILRPRTIIYSVALLAIMGALVFSVLTRSPVDLDVIRDRNTLYRINDAGAIENVYTLRLMNKDEHDRELEVRIAGLQDVKIELNTNPISIQGGEVVDIGARVSVPDRGESLGSRDVVFSVYRVGDGELLHEELARFLGPQ